MDHDGRLLTGRRGEKYAVRHLLRRGYRILERNHRTRFGEIDIVAVDGCTLVFVEVKTRRQGAGAPWDSLGPAKCRQVRTMARRWLSDSSSRHGSFSAMRFDAIGITLDTSGRLMTLNHLQSAF